MPLYSKTLQYFHELSVIPRPSRGEGKIRKWLKKWAQGNKWEYKQDEIGNLMIYAPGEGKNTLCLQSHMDMVCVSVDKSHDFEKEGIEVIDDGKILRGNETTLGADNGVGVAAMMAVAEMKKRPSLELLFTMGEEIGLIGAYHLELPITAKYGINLDWCDSTSIGIGCGGTLLMKGKLKGKRIKKEKGKKVKLRLLGMRGGHSGVEIQENHGNAIIELCRIIGEKNAIQGVSMIKGGDADNAIPRSARAVVLYQGKISELEKWLAKREKKLIEKFNCENIALSAEVVDDEGPMYEKTICRVIAKLGSGIQRWYEDKVSPLSSWNVGKIKLTEGEWKWCHFLRTNKVGGITPMKKKILKQFDHFGQKLTWKLSHEGPVWLADAQSPFVGGIVKSIKSVHGKSIPAVTMHATMEAGTLAEKSPTTEWVSIGATCHDMHTTREHIYKADLKEFCERLEVIIGNL